MGWVMLNKTDGQGNKTFVGDGVLNAGIDNLKRNPVLHQMQKDIAKINEAVLDEAVRRGTASSEWANAAITLRKVCGNGPWATGGNYSCLYRSL